MIHLKKNANQLINNIVHEDGVSAFYLDVCEKYSKGYIQTFITTLQTLITKVGIIISSVDYNGVAISYCSQSIEYLCKKVLDDERLFNKFSEVGINSKGNNGKHRIETQHINIDKAVSLFNTLINSIVNKYNLPSLKYLIIKKKNTVNQKNNENYSSYYHRMYDAPKKNEVTRTPLRNNNPNDTATTCDERIKLKADLKIGDGRYKKGIFKKVSMVNFQLHVFIDNPNNLKISSVIATIKCGNNTETKKLSTENNSITDFDLDTNRFSGNIVVTIIATYKIGLFKAKTIKATVSKSF